MDNHVGAALFKDVIKGSLKNKTRVLVTNALQYLPQADQIVVLEEGKVQEIDVHILDEQRFGLFKVDETPRIA